MDNERRDAAGRAAPYEEAGDAAHHDRRADGSGAGRENGPATEGLRIAAVEAAVAAGLAPSTSRVLADPILSEPSVSLPDWTDPPTGQVPRVLLEADTDTTGLDDPLSTRRGPTWRQHGSDWDEEEGLDLSFLTDEGPDPRIATSEIVGDDVPFDLAFDGLDIPVAPAPRQSDTAPADVDDDAEAAWAAFLADDQARRGEPAEGAAATTEADDGVPRARRRRSAARRGAHLARPSLAATPLPAAVEAAPLLEAAVHDLEVGAERVLAPLTTAAPRQRRDGGAQARPRAGRPDPAGEQARQLPRPPGQAPGKRNPLLATVTGVVSGAVGLGCFLAGAQASLVLVSLLVAVATGELLGTLRRAGHRPATALALVAVPALVVGAYLRGSGAIPLVLGLTVVLTMVWYLVGERGERPATGAGLTLLAVVWIGGLGAFAGLLLAPSAFPHRHGVGFLAAAVALTVANDVGAYAVGAKWGRRRIAPSVSPSKSLEGLLGGTVLTLVVAVVAVAHIRPFDTGKALVLGLAAVVLAPLGDLAESLIKRDIGVKDMGSVLPAHGGVLDRLDGMLFVLPGVYYLVEAFHLT